MRREEKQEGGGWVAGRWEGWQIRTAAVGKESAFQEQQGNLATQTWSLGLLRLLLDDDEDDDDDDNDRAVWLPMWQPAQGTGQRHQSRHREVVGRVYV